MPHPRLAPPTTSRPRQDASHPSSHKPIPPSASNHDTAFAAISTWESNASEEHLQTYRDIAKKIADIWKDKSKTSLIIDNRYITNLPPLPSHLTQLSLMNCNNLTELPDLSVCLQLKSLQLAGCGRLAELPDLTVCRELQELNLMGVSVGGEAERILGLPKECSIMLEASCVVHEVYVQLNEAIAAQGYRGPKIRMFGALQERLFTVCRLTSEVKLWMPTADGGAWKAIEKETNAHVFSQYLGGIRETADYKDPRWKPFIQERVKNLLCQLQQPENQALRKGCFDIALTATGTCGDGIAATLLDMERICRTHQAQVNVEKGKYDNDPTGLLMLSKGMYLLESLRKIADDKVQTLKAEGHKNIDEIEVSYGYFLCFSERISRFLGVELKAMLYSRDSQIKKEDKMAAATALESQSHQDEWMAFLANWPPMDSLLIRLGHKNIIDEASSRIEEQQERFVEAMGELLCEDKKLTSQEYVEKQRELTVEYKKLEKRGKEINLDKKRGIINQLLEQHGLDAKLL